MGVSRIQQKLYRLPLNIQIEVNQIIADLDRYLVGKTHCMVSTEPQCWPSKINAVFELIQEVTAKDALESWPDADL